MRAKGTTPRPGSADLCFICAPPLEVVEESLKELGVKVEAGPVERTGAIGKIALLYFRNPGVNLIESNYVS